MNDLQIKTIIDEFLKLFLLPKGNPFAIFIETLMRCIIGSFLIGLICRILTTHHKKKFDFIIIIVVVVFYSFYILNNNSIFLQKISLFIIQRKYIMIILSSQIGRFAVLIVSFQVIKKIEELPFMLYSYVILVYFYGLHSLAFKITNNLL